MSTRLLPVDDKSYVIPGACLDAETDHLLRCALDKNDCVDGSVYWSPQELENEDDSAGHDCLHVRVDQMTGFGRCVDKNGQSLCTNDSFSCENYQNDWKDDETCSGSKDLSESPDERNTLYAGCHYLPEPISNAFCVYNPYDCPDDDNPDWEFFEGYLTAEAMEYPCTCEKVMTGACVFEDVQYVCAVSPEACDGNSKFVNVVDMFDVDLECFLCSETASTESNYDGTLAVQAQPLPEEALPRAASNDGGMTGGLIFVLVVGVLVVVGVMGLWMVRRRKRNNTQPKTVEMSTPSATIS